MAKVLNRNLDKIPYGAQYIGRGSKWGNPFVIGKDGSRETVIRKYIAWLPSQLREDAKKELKGRDLVCFCAPEACHGDILLLLANGETDGQPEQAGGCQKP